MRTLDGVIAPVAADDVLSPELALVDPDLAARARERLTDPASSVPHRRELAPSGDLAEAMTRRIAQLALAPPATPRVEPVAPPVQLPPPGGEAEAAAQEQARVEPLAPPVQQPPSGNEAESAAQRLAHIALAAPDVEQLHEAEPRRRHVLAGVVASCAAFAIAFLIADRALERDAIPTAAEMSVELEEPDATAEAPVETTPARTAAPGGDQEEPPATTPTPTTSQPPQSKSPSTTPARGSKFAWAPVANASGYHVELFRAGSRIFATNTSRPETPIPASWTSPGVVTVSSPRSTAGTSGRSSRVNAWRRPSSRRSSSSARRNEFRGLCGAIPRFLRPWGRLGDRDFRKLRILTGASSDPDR